MMQRLQEYEPVDQMKVKEEEAYEMRFVLYHVEHEGVDAESTEVTMEAEEEAGKGMHHCILTNN